MSMIQIIPLEGIPLIKKGDCLGKIISEAARMQNNPIQEGDILIITHVVVSKAEGCLIDLDSITPSSFSYTIAKEMNRDPQLIEAILQQSKSIIKMGNGHIIAETKHGFICANAGIDKSNIQGNRVVAPLPDDPDNSAREIRNTIRILTGKDVAVIISDTHGRALRRGAINIAIGVAGIKPINDFRGEKDIFGYILKIKQIAVADELCSSAELVIGQANESIPIALIRGYNYEKDIEVTAKDLIWSKEKALFF